MSVKNVFKFEATGALTVGANKDRWQAPVNGQVIAVNAVVGTAPTGADLILDVLKDGQSILTAGALRVVADQTESTTVNLTNEQGRFAVGETLSLSVTQVGSTVAGSDLDVSVAYQAL